MTRYLLSTNSPWASTGYGQQCKGIARGIKQLGYQVAIQGWWGLEGGPMEWEGITVFPRHLDGYGNDASAYYCRKWHADLLITLIDLWVVDPQLGHMGNTRWAPLFPIDSNPIPPPVAERFPHAYRLLCYSQDAVKLVSEYDGGKYASKVRYLPHGIPCDVLTPGGEDEKRMLRKKFFPDWPEDAYICQMVAANKGYPCRKSFPEVMEAFAQFAAHHPEARLYLHSYRGPEMKGPPLDQLAGYYGILDRVRLANPTIMLAGDYTEQMMRDLYVSADVLLSPSQGEGFGLPILEAQSTGLPVIVTDHSAMREIVGLGWRVPPLRIQPTLIGGGTALADVPGILHAMEECYRRPKSAYWTAIAREFALQFHWPTVVERYWKPFLAEMDGGRRELAMELEAMRSVA